jgi:hypothetical protein
VLPYRPTYFSLYRLYYLLSISIIIAISSLRVVSLDWIFIIASLISGFKP